MVATDQTHTNLDFGDIGVHRAEPRQDRQPLPTAAKCRVRLLELRKIHEHRA